MNGGPDGSPLRSDAGSTAAVAVPGVGQETAMVTYDEAARAYDSAPRGGCGELYYRNAVAYGEFRQACVAIAEAGGVAPETYAPLLWEFRRLHGLWVARLPGGGGPDAFRVRLDDDRCWFMPEAQEPGRFLAPLLVGNQPF